MGNYSKSDLSFAEDALLASAIHGDHDAVVEIAKLPPGVWSRGDRAAVASAIRALQERGERVEPGAVFAIAHKHIEYAGQVLGEVSAAQPTLQPQREAKVLHEAFARHEFSRKARQLSRIPQDIPLEDYRHILEDTDLFESFPGRDGQLTPIDMSGWAHESPPELEFVFEGLVPRSTLAGIVAQGGLGKGWLTQELITSLAIGRELVDGFVPSEAMSVLWLESEDPPEEIHRRHAKIVHAFGISQVEHDQFARNVRLYAGEAFPLVKVENGNVIPTEHYTELRSIVREWRPDMIVIDPLSHFYGGDENDNVVMAAFMNLLKALGRDTKTTIWVNHHVSKDRQDDLSPAMGRGASALRDAVRSLFALAPLERKEIEDFGISDSSLYVRLGHLKSNWTGRTGGVKYFKRDVSKKSVSGVLRAVDLESEKQVVAEQMMDRAANELAVIIGENPDDLTARQISKSDKGADIRYELERKFPRLAKTRIIGGLLARAESRGFLNVEKKGKARIPRKNNDFLRGFSEELKQTDTSEQEVCPNAQGTGTEGLSESGQTKQEIPCSDSHKALSDSDLENRNKAAP